MWRWFKSSQGNSLVRKALDPGRVGQGGRLLLSIWYKILFSRAMVLESKPGWPCRFGVSSWSLARWYHCRGPSQVVLKFSFMTLWIRRAVWGYSPSLCILGRGIGTLDCCTWNIGKILLKKNGPLTGTWSLGTNYQAFTIHFLTEN